MSTTMYSIIMQLGDARYYTRLSFDIARAITEGNVVDIADADAKAIVMAGNLASLSGATLTAVSKGIFYDDAALVADADPDFENTAKLLTDFGDDVVKQLRIPAVEPGTDLVAWFTANKATIYGPIFQGAIDVVQTNLTQQRKPRASV